jgi:hypothetical protein
MPLLLKLPFHMIYFEEKREEEEAKKTKKNKQNKIK